MTDADLSCQAGQPTHDFCLGVKLALYKDCDVDDYRLGICDHYLSNFPMVGTEPCCARKVVEQALQYAQGLGFAPHSRLYKRPHESLEDCERSSVCHRRFENRINSPV